MFSALRRRLHVSPTAVIATLALVFALTGGAYAASGRVLITSTKQIKPSVLEATDRQSRSRRPRWCGGRCRSRRSRRSGRSGRCARAQRRTGRARGEWHQRKRRERWYDRLHLDPPGRQDRAGHLGRHGTHHQPRVVLRRIHRRPDLPQHPPAAAVPATLVAPGTPEGSDPKDAPERSNTRGPNRVISASSRVLKRTWMRPAAEPA